MKLMLCLCTVAVLAISAGVRAESSGVHAESIGVHFIGKDAKKSTLEANQKAGVVPQDHWNNLSISNDDGNGHGNSGKLDKVTDDSGKDVKGVSVSVSGTDTAQVWSGDGASWGFSDNNLILQTGMLSPSPQITIKGIPYKKYSVYVYVASGNNGGQGSAAIEVANKVKGKVDTNSKYYVNYNWQNGNFVKSEAKTLDAAKASKGSNYIVFTDNTASDITVQFNGTEGGGWIGCSGIQIVPVAEK